MTLLNNFRQLFAQPTNINPTQLSHFNAQIISTQAQLQLKGGGDEEDDILIEDIIGG